jgi:hypothetical protein
MAELTYTHIFTDKTCILCEGNLVEDYWSASEFHSVERSRIYCPKCLFHAHIKIIMRNKKWLSSVRHVLNSKEVTFIRTVTEEELIKKHGVYAWWFPIGRKIYIEPAFFGVDETEDLKNFKKDNVTENNILVYLPNNYLQRLYFFVPKNAIA